VRVIFVSIPVFNADPLARSNLNRRRYAQNDETLYVAPEDDRTDYSQPPMSNWYPGVLNTGKRRYVDLLFVTQEEF